MQGLSKWTMVIVVAVAVLVASPVHAGTWAIPSGSTGVGGSPLNFSYSNGQDLNGLFGDPSVIFGDAFFFTTSFSTLADDLNSTPLPVADTMSVDILADPGLKFSSVSVTASGSYGITTVGSVNLDATLLMRENTPTTVPVRTFSDTLATFDSGTGNPLAFPITTPGGGTYNGSALVDVEFVFPTPSDDIHIELSNSILAISGPGGSAFINVQLQNLRIGFNVIPEPASASLLMTGLFAAVVRRRRRR